MSNPPPAASSGAGPAPPATRRGRKKKQGPRPPKQPRETPAPQTSPQHKQGAAGGAPVAQNTKREPLERGRFRELARGMKDGMEFVVLEAYDYITTLNYKAQAYAAGDPIITVMRTPVAIPASWAAQQAELWDRYAMADELVYEGAQATSAVGQIGMFLDRDVSDPEIPLGGGDSNITIADGHTVNARCKVWEDVGVYAKKTSAREDPLFYVNPSAGEPRTSISGRWTVFARTTLSGTAGMPIGTLSWRRIITFARRNLTTAGGPGQAQGTAALRNPSGAGMSAANPLGIGSALNAVVGIASNLPVAQVISGATAPSILVGGLNADDLIEVVATLAAASGTPGFADAAQWTKNVFNQVNANVGLFQGMGATNSATGASMSAIYEAFSTYDDGVTTELYLKPSLASGTVTGGSSATLSLNKLARSVLGAREGTARDYLPQHMRMFLLPDGAEPITCHKQWTRDPADPRLRLIKHFEARGPPNPASAPAQAGGADAFLALMSRFVERMGDAAHDPAASLRTIRPPRPEARSGGEPGDEICVAEPRAPAAAALPPITAEQLVGTGSGRRTCEAHSSAKCSCDGIARH